MSRIRDPIYTRGAILDAAIDLFIKKGYDQTTTDDILKKAGLSRGALYHYFSSKQAISQAIPEHLLKGDEDYQHIFEDQTLNSLERARQLYQNGIRKFLVIPERRLYLKILNETSLLGLLMESINTQVIPQYEWLIREGNQDGSMKVENPKAVAQMLAVLLNIWCMPLVPGTAEEYYERILLLKGQLEFLGMPFFDDETLQLCRAYSEILNDVLTDKLALSDESSSR